MNEFIEAFAETIGQSQSQAKEQWDGFSRQLSDRERQIVENGGRQSGIYEGKCYLELYPKD